MTYTIKSDRGTFGHAATVDEAVSMIAAAHPGKPYATKTYSNGVVSVSFSPIMGFDIFPAQVATPVQAAKAAADRATVSQIRYLRSLIAGSPDAAAECFTKGKSPEAMTKAEASAAISALSSIAIR